MYDGETFLVKKAANTARSRSSRAKPSACRRTPSSWRTCAYYFRTNNLNLKAVITEKRDNSADAFFCRQVRGDDGGRVRTRRSRDRQSSAPGRFSRFCLSRSLRSRSLRSCARATISFLTSCAGRSLRSSMPRNWGSIRNNAEPYAQQRQPRRPKVLCEFAPRNREARAELEHAIVKTIGNYGQIYDRHLGSGSPAKLERGLNRLWTKGA